MTQASAVKQLIYFQMLSSPRRAAFCVSPFCPDRTNELVNQFASDCFRPFNSGCSDFWIQMRVRVSDLFGGHCWRGVRQLDPVVEEFSFENVYFHDDSLFCDVIPYSL